ncbi:glycoside hydrolase domain-containing protein, partial [Streptomyces nigra]
GHSNQVAHHVNYMYNAAGQPWKTQKNVREVLSGVRELKFFPAEAAGGTAYLRSLYGPLPQVRFCPTGGIGPGSAPDYLALPNVACVGGSWMLPADAVAARDWARVETLAREAAGLGRSAAQV